MVNSGISEENQKENLLKIGYKNLQQDNPAETLPEAEKVRKYGFSFTDGKESKFLKPFQNKKGQKKLRYPTKKQSFSKEKTAFLSGISIFFGPSYFETTLVFNQFRTFGFQKSI